MIVMGKNPVENALNLHISDFLIEYRTRHNITQGEMAEIAQTNQQIISLLESGTRNVTISTLSEILDNLGAKVKLTIWEENKC